MRVGKSPQQTWKQQTLRMDEPERGRVFHAFGGKKTKAERVYVGILIEDELSDI